MITLIVPYYRNPRMLEFQARRWIYYPAEITVVVVDDGSPDYPAAEVLKPESRAHVYRIDVDIPWNRNGARNLGAFVANTPWLLHVDVDHVLEPDDARRLVARPLDPKSWYRFKRYRIGAADATRKKDSIDPAATFGEIKPHVDSFLCRRDLYWSVGGYDEDFSGSIGGSAPFLSHLEAAAPCVTLSDVALRVHTTNAVPDASDVHLSRDRSRYERIRAQKRQAGDPIPTEHLRFPWHRVR